MPPVDVAKLATDAFHAALSVSIEPLLEKNAASETSLQGIEAEFGYYMARMMAGDPNAQEDLHWLREEGESLVQVHALKDETKKGKYFEMVLAAVARSVFIALKGAIGIPNLG